MTTTAAPTRTELLTARMTTLVAERDQALAETRGEATGDIADRATNVEASIRLSTLDERIHALAEEIDASRKEHHTEGVVSIGDSVVLDLGDGPESFMIGSVEQALAGVETVTPASPLGRAIIGSSEGATVTYSPRKGVTLSATIVSAA